MMTDYQRKERGAYYTPPEITDYLSRQTLGQLIITRLRECEPTLPYEQLDGVLANLNPERCQRLARQILPRLRIVDPCCGDGAFLIAALDVLVQVYEAIISSAGDDDELLAWVNELGDSPAARIRILKQRIIADNLYGVDISADAVTIARAKLLVEAELTEQATSNIRVGNALVGLLQMPGDSVGADALLLAEFRGLEIKRVPGGGSLLEISDIAALQPFHWAMEFAAILADGGFDVALTNPPWEIFKPQAKEFFAQYSEIISKKRMGIHAFVAEQERLLRDPQVAAAWADYLARFPILSAYYRAAPQYAHQSANIAGRRTSSDPNLYKLFVEQCYNLLREGGECGMVIPSGIYTDLGATALRRLLFEQTTVRGLFGFENRRAIFANVDNRFKFVALTFGKGGSTAAFPATFMRHDVSELADLASQISVRLPLALVARLSPTSHSVMELKSQRDLQIVEKMLRFPLLGDEAAGRLRLTSELHMTNDSALFEREPVRGRLPLYEGKMIWQFDSNYAPPRYWVDEQAGRRALLGKQDDGGQPLGYQFARLGIRAIASSTNQRSLIASIIPARVFCANSLLVSAAPSLADELHFYAALLNSYVLDWFIRMKVTTNINMFYIYQLPVPRYAAGHANHIEIVLLAERLICQPEGKVEGRDKSRPYNVGQRGGLDVLVAHLYGLSKQEFAYILDTFKLRQGVRDALLDEY